VVDASSDDGPVEVAAIRRAVDAIRNKRAAALVTGPINKEALVAQGFAFAGHTEFLAHLCDVPRPVMAFVGGRVRVALVTTHLPIREVPDALTQAKVLHAITIAHAALHNQLGVANPHVLVCGLNPHAGEGGVLGHEDDAVIAPAVQQAKANGIDAVGPMSAETAFRRAVDGAADLVVAMYHDQGLVPLKVLDFGRTVNWTLGLPIIRTSVDHGTARDIAGKGIADPASMVAALSLAEQLTSGAP
jgi:4-hydroxythreonine-4-phosphate dehydrogenase